MKIVREVVRTLEQQESGDIRRLRCSRCGERSFKSSEQLARHEQVCGAAAAAAKLDVKKAS